MIREYRIPNKVNDILRHFNGDRMNTILVHSGCGQVVHITKEFQFIGWHRPVVSIGIADEKEPHKVFKASFDSKEKLNMLIRLLENHRNSFDNQGN